MLEQFYESDKDVSLCHIQHVTETGLNKYRNKINN